MKFTKWMAIAFATLAITLQLSAQDKSQPKHHQYKLYDVGTFGGPSSFPSIHVIGVTAAGAIGGAETTIPDPFAPNCLNGDCLVDNAFVWRDGVLTNLGALPGNNGGNSSYTFAITNGGFAAGISENGSIDPDTGYPEVNAVIWNKGVITNLGTFGGTQSAAENVNNGGQVVGVATNSIPDPFSFGGGAFPATTQSRAFLWNKGVMRDLGTLGGPDAFGFYINASGQVSGWSYTSYTPNPSSGVPTVDPFVWDKGRMIDLGTLGGTFGQPNWINSRGQVVGSSNVAGDQSYHGFLWDRGVLTDLGTLGGTYSYAAWINDGGDIAGVAGLPGDTAFPAALWIHGQIMNIGTLPGDNLGNANSINSSKQVVGLSCLLPCNDLVAYRGFLWENGSMADLDSLVENLGDLHIYRSDFIADNGVIYAQAATPGLANRGVVLVPDGDCGGVCEQRIAASQSRSPAVQSSPTPGKLPDWVRNPLGKHMMTPH
jgi:probable HAF family extracellular repeat protein